MNENITIIRASMDRELHDRLTQKLKQMECPLDDWLDKITRQYLHLPPKFSYDKPEQASKVELADG